MGFPPFFIYSCLFPNSYVRVRYLSTTPHAQGIHQALVCETSPWESHPRRVLRRLRREVSLTPVLVIATTESNSDSTTWVLSLTLNKGHGALVGSAWGFPQHKERTWWMYIQLSKCIAGFCPTIPYSNFWGRKTTHFLKLFQKNFLGSCKTSRKQKIPPWNSQREVPYILLYLHRQNGQLVKTQKTKKDPLPFDSESCGKL